MTTATPQQMEALALANRVKAERMGIRTGIGNGEITVAEAIEDEHAQGMKVMELLRAQNRWGEGKSRKVLGAVGASRYNRVSELTPRQRDMIVHLTGGA